MCFVFFLLTFLFMYEKGKEARERERREKTMTGDTEQQQRHRQRCFNNSPLHGNLFSEHPKKGFHTDGPNPEKQTDKINSTMFEYSSDSAHLVDARPKSRNSPNGLFIFGIFCSGNARFLPVLTFFPLFLSL